jgi:hypothetical protein
MWLLAGLHVLTLVAVVVILVMRLKVMLLVIDVIVAMSTLYLLSGVGFYGATLLAHESSRGLQPFVYPWGESFSDNSTNYYYFNFMANIFSSCGPQIVIVFLCLILCLKTPEKGEEHVWPYYRLGFVLAFGLDFLMGALSIFFWSSYTSILTSYSTTIGALLILWLLI